MAYVATCSFSTRAHGAFCEGDPVEVLPEGVDWLEAGFVEPVEAGETDVPFTPKPTSSAIKYAVHDRGKGWYDVVGPAGEPANEKALREAEAQALADELNA